MNISEPSTPTVLETVESETPTPLVSEQIKTGCFRLKKKRWMSN